MPSCLAASAKFPPAQAESGRQWNSQNPSKPNPGREVMDHPVFRCSPLNKYMYYRVRHLPGYNFIRWDIYALSNVYVFEPVFSNAITVQFSVARKLQNNPHRRYPGQGRTLYSGCGCEGAITVTCTLKQRTPLLRWRRGQAPRGRRVGLASPF